MAGEFRGESPGNTRELGEQEENDEKEEEDKDLRDEMLVFFAGKLTGSALLDTILVLEESMWRKKKKKKRGNVIQRE